MRRWIPAAAALVILGGCGAPATTHVAATPTANGWPIPDLRLTPGDVLTTDTHTVCTPGYAASVRNVSVATKREVYARYGVTYTRLYAYEVDHDIPLELGGSNAITNLWPQRNDRPRSNAKDLLENRLHSIVCAGELTLPEAQAAIRGDWTPAYDRWIGGLGEFVGN